MEQQHIFNAASAGDHEALARLLNEQPDIVSTADNFGMTVLHYAARSGSAVCIMLCLNAIIRQPNLDIHREINRRTNTNEDALTLAASSGKFECIAVLAGAGFDAEYRTNPRANFHLLLDCLRLMRSDTDSYDYNRFYHICAQVTVFENYVPGVEELLLYICQDAVEQWTVDQPIVKQCLMQISKYCLSHIVCHTQSLRIVNQLKSFGAFVLPNGLQTWLEIFRQWGVVKLPYMTDEVQQCLLDGLAGLRTDEPSRPIVDDQQMLASILYLAVLASRFPRADWLQYWHELCSKAGITQTSYMLQTLLESFEDGSCLQAFWENLFLFVIGRILAVFKFEYFPSNSIETAYKQFLNHAFKSVTTLHPKVLKGHTFGPGNMINDLLTQFNAFMFSLNSSFLIDFCRKYLFPWMPADLCTLVTYAGFPHFNDRYFFFRNNFIDVCLDFSPKLTLNLFTLNPCGVHCPPASPVTIGEYHIVKFCSMCILALLETFCSSPVEKAVVNLVADTWLHSLQYSKVFVDLISPPYSLFRLAKCSLRVCLRMHNEQTGEYPKKSLSQLVNQLQLTPDIKKAVIEPCL